VNYAVDGRAALMLGMTFDRAFLNIDRLRGVRGDSAAAISWYTRAGKLGQAEAEVLLIKLDPEFSNEAAVRRYPLPKKSSLSSKTYSGSNGHGNG
jgi:TPR repeat protein